MRRLVLRRAVTVRVFVRRNPFLVLALATMLIGVIWHLAPMDRDTGPGSLAYGAVSVIGFPFITATRFMNRVVDAGALAGLLALPLGLAPYLLADLLWRRTRRAAAERRP